MNFSIQINKEKKFSSQNNTQVQSTFNKNKNQEDNNKNLRI